MREFFPKARILAPLLKFLLPILLFLLFLSLMKYSALRVPWYERMLWNLVGPVQRGFHAASSSVDDIWSGYIALRGVRHENIILRKQNQELAQELIVLEEVRQENERLKMFLEYQNTVNVPMLVARVIASNARAEFRTLAINMGKKDGVRMFMPVIGFRGAVGRIAKIFPHSSIVLLLDDPNSNVDALVQRSRVRGLLVGLARGAELRHGASLTRMEYLNRQSDIVKGDVVITSGFDQLFPPGIPIGTVEDIEIDGLGIFQQAKVVPFEHFFEIQEVLVLQYSPEALEFK